MRSVNRLDSQNWLVSADHAAYLVSMQRGPHGVVCFTIGEVLPDERPGRLLSIEKEIWSGKIFTARPRNALSDLTACFFECRELEAPVELAYEWGGTLGGRPIATTSIHRGLLQ
jgi:hypothetical protein